MQRKSTKARTALMARFCVGSAPGSPGRAQGKSHGRWRFITSTVVSLSLAILIHCVHAGPAYNLKISHQFPGGTITEGDFRDRLCRMFAVEIEKRTKGQVTATVYPSSSLMKTNAQFSAMRKGALDMSLFPISYAGGEVPELNIGLMPGVVTSYEQGISWKNAEVGKLLSEVLYEKGIIMVSWIWQAGGVAGRSKGIVEPEDAKGLKIRGWKPRDGHGLSRQPAHQ